MNRFFNATKPMPMPSPTPPVERGLCFEDTLLAQACEECLGCDGLDWACLRLKVALVARIQQEMQRQGLSQTAAARRMGISQPEVSRLLAGKLRYTSERKLMGCLNRLGFDIELNIRPAQAATGELRLQA